MSTIPLIIEQHPENYNGLPYLTLVMYNNAEHLVVVDNISEGELRIYHIEECAQYDINVAEFLQHVDDWYHYNTSVPLSVYLSSNGLTSMYSNIYKSFNIEFVSRLIGPIPKYKLRNTSTVKKRKRKPVPVESTHIIKEVHELA